MSDMIRILHIEDDLVDMELLREFLDNEPRFNYQLKQFKDIESAREAIESEGLEFDLSIIDLGLSKTRGIATYFKFLELGLDLPIVVLTGLDDKETGEKVISEGGQDYLIKGKFNSCNLVHAIRFAIGRFEIENKLKDRELQFRSVIENVFDALLIIDNQGIIESANPAASDIFGYDMAELLGLHIKELVIETNQFLLKEIIKRVSAEEIRQVEMEGICKDGSEIIIQVSCKQLLLKDANRILVVIHDVTEMVKAEVELRKHRDHLEELVEQKTKEVEEKYYELAKDYELMLGREFRIKELREEVKELKKKIAVYEK